MLREKSGLRDRRAGGHKSSGGGDKIMSIYMYVKDGIIIFIAISVIITDHYFVFTPSSSFISFTTYSNLS